MSVFPFEQAIISEDFTGESKTYILGTFFLGFIYFTSMARARMLCESFSTFLGYNQTCKVLDLDRV